MMSSRSVFVLVRRTGEPYETFETVIGVYLYRRDCENSLHHYADPATFAAYEAADKRWMECYRKHAVAMRDSGEITITDMRGWLAQEAIAVATERTNKEVGGRPARIADPRDAGYRIDEFPLITGWNQPARNIA